MEVVTAVLLDELARAGVPVARVDTSDPHDEPGNRGHWTLHNALVSLSDVASAVRQTLRRDVVAVLVPISQERPAFYRDALFMLIARLSRKQIVVHLHGGAFGRFYAEETRSMRLLIRATVGRAAVGIVLSERLRPTLECVLPPERVVAIPNGVAVPQMPRTLRRNGSVHVLLLSNLFPTKGVHVLIKALARAREQNSELVATIAGTWPTPEIEAETRRLAEDLNVADAVEFPGTVTGDAKAQLLSNSDIFCLPSFYPLEGTPFVIIEAMAAGLPVVATRWSGIPDMIEHGVSGLLVDTADPDLVAEQLSRLVADSGERRRLGEGARRRYIDEFTPAAFGTRMQAVLRPLLEARSD
jgi:glycosyltransferase involved in cell wall biosynthesis